jgi:hypothetical protein
VCFYWQRASVGDLSGSLLFGSLDTSGLLLGPMTDQPPPLALNQLGELPNMLSQSDISMLLAQIQLEQSSAPASQSDAGSLMYNFGQPMSGSMGAPQMPVAGAAGVAVGVKRQGRNEDNADDACQMRRPRQLWLDLDSVPYRGGLQCALVDLCMNMNPMPLLPMCRPGRRWPRDSRRY